MSKNIYLSSGYLDTPFLRSRKVPFNFIVGNRGCGKTYGFLEDCIKNNLGFMYVRRLQVQIDVISTPEYNPFKKLNTDHGWSIGARTLAKNTAGFYEMAEDEKGSFSPVGAPKGYAVALSTFANLRGFDASDVDVIIYDEFIPEKHEKKIRGEGEALLNLYETVNRNREIEGQDPVQLWCLANSNDLANEIFLYLNLVSITESMQRSGQEYTYIKDRGIGLYILKDSPIAKKKEQTALYRMTAGTDFSQMALKNEFTAEDKSHTAHRNLKEYKPVVTVGEITIYKHKSKNEYYCCSHRLGSCPVYGGGDVERKRFQRAYHRLWCEYMQNKIYFEQYLYEILFQKYMG